RLGSMVYAEPGVNAVHFGVQHSEVQDHRPEFGSTYGLARLPIGHLTLEPVGGISAIDWRLDLWNAELRGAVTTAAGSLQLRAFAHNSRSVLVVEVTPSEGERDFRRLFHPEDAISPRAAGRQRWRRSTSAGGTTTTARASCRYPTSACRASTGSSSTRWPRRPGARRRSWPRARRGWSRRRGRPCGGT